jgi:hypothetical protein
MIAQKKNPKKPDNNHQDPDSNQRDLDLKSARIITRAFLLISAYQELPTCPSKKWVGRKESPHTRTAGTTYRPDFSSQALLNGPVRRGFGY